MMDPNAALVAAQAALEVASNKRRALWNYGVVLFHSGFKDVGMQFLENGLEPSLPNAEASYAKAQRGEPVKLPVFAL
jgi:hypothetical protein